MVRWGSHNFQEMSMIFFFLNMLLTVKIFLDIQVGGPWPLGPLGTTSELY